jgi:hypothetical protein
VDNHECLPPIVPQTSIRSEAIAMQRTRHVSASVQILLCHCGTCAGGTAQLTSVQQQSASCLCALTVDLS